MAELKKTQREAIASFLEAARDNRLTKATVASIPFVGAGLEKLLYDDADKADVDAVARLVARNSESTVEILDAVQAVLRKVSPAKISQPLIVIGSGNADWLIQADQRVVLGKKNFLSSEQGYGGSGFNCSSRLLAAGYPAIPILSTGKDPVGEGIRNKLEFLAKRAPFSQRQLELFSVPSFFADGIRTPQSVVMVDGDRRTIFAESFKVPDDYKQRIDERVTQIVEASEGTVAGVMIGHIHGRGESAESVRRATVCALDRFHETCPVVLNFGASQIEQGAERWLQPMQRAAVTLMNFEESLQFFAGTECRTLSQIIRWYQKNQISAVITFGRFGAVACHPSEPNLILAWPYLERHEVVDSTGAGDAMAAGILASLSERASSDARDIQRAIEEGRLWAAIACMSRGAASQCPDRSELQTFQRDRLVRRRTGRGRAVEVLDYALAEPWLDLIDLAFH